MKLPYLMYYRSPETKLKDVKHVTINAKQWCKQYANAEKQMKEMLEELKKKYPDATIEG